MIKIYIQNYLMENMFNKKIKIIITNKCGIAPTTEKYNELDIV